MCKYKTLLERQTFRHFGYHGGFEKFDVRLEWAFRSDECSVSCGDNKGIEIYKGLSIACDLSDRGEILKVGWNYLCDCEMEDYSYRIESRSWIVEYEDKLYAVFFDEAKKKGYVEYTINHLRESKARLGADYSVKKGTKRLNIENREELLGCVESLIDEYEKIIII